MKISFLDRLFLIATIFLASYEIVKGIENYPKESIVALTIGFGVLVIASILIFIFGIQILENNYIPVVSSIIPFSFAYTLFNVYMDKYSKYFLAFLVIGFFIVAISRFSKGKIIKTLTLSFFHAISGILIVFIPILLFLGGKAEGKIVFISIGGTIIGVGGILLSFIRAGKPIIPEKLVYKVLTPLLFFVVLFLVLGI